MPVRYTKTETQEPEKPTMTASVNLVAGAIHFEADADNPRFLHFRDAVLARPETNSNGDNINEDGIKELAASIAGTHINWEHRQDKCLGVFTAGRVGSEGELRVDGIIWPDACDALGVDPDEIVKNALKTSIEATALTAECTICHTVHSGIESYCVHLIHKAKFGAQRLLRGLRAVGGAITKRPAGSLTGFSGVGATVMFIASHQESDDDPMNAEVSEELESKINERVEVLPADKNEEKSSMSTVDEESLEAKKEVPEKEVKETPEEEKKEAPAEEKKEVEACDMKAYAEMKSAVEKMAAELEAAKKTAEELAREKENFAKECEGMKAELESAKNEAKASRREALKAKLVGSALDAEEFETMAEDLLIAPASVIAKLMANKPVSSSPQKMSAAREPEMTSTAKWF